jgi:hypothetical protein
MEGSGSIDDFGVVVVPVVVVVNDGYFFNKSSCFIEPKRTNTGVLDFVRVLIGSVGTFRSMDKRGFVVVDESVANARNGPLGRVGFAGVVSIDDRGLLIELVVELIDERRLLVSGIDVCLRKFLFYFLNRKELNCTFVVD